MTPTACFPCVPGWYLINGMGKGIGMGEHNYENANKNFTRPENCVWLGADHLGVAAIHVRVDQVSEMIFSEYPEGDQPKLKSGIFIAVDGVQIISTESRTKVNKARDAAVQGIRRCGAEAGSQARRASPGERAPDAEHADRPHRSRDREANQDAAEHQVGAHGRGSPECACELTSSIA